MLKLDQNDLQEEKLFKQEQLNRLKNEEGRLDEHCKQIKN